MNPTPLSAAVDDALHETPPSIRRMDEQADRDLAMMNRALQCRHVTEIQRLAKLDPIDYDRERDAAAEKLGVRVSTLDGAVKAERKATDPATAGHEVTFTEPDPWPDLVEVGALLDAIMGTLKRYVRMRGAAAVACALWVLHTWVQDAARVSPILAITSPEKRCGKTTLLEVLGALVRRPMPTSNVTSAALFRAVEKFSPGLLIDEADTFLRASDELRGVLNSGHRRASAFVIRCVGDNQEPRQFRTWAPKAIALIGKLPETLADRSIEVALRRRGPAEKLERWKGETDPDLTRKLARFAIDHAEALGATQPELPTGLHDRAKDNWEPLLAIADLAGGKWPKLARDATEVLSGTESESAGAMLLADIKRYFDERNTDRVHSTPLAEWLAKLEDRPWPEWGRAQKPITARQVAKLLEPYGVKPKQVRIGPDNLQGYTVEAFKVVFEHYLPCANPTTLQHNGGAGCSDSVNPTPKIDVGDRKALEAKQDATCSVVRDREAAPAREGTNGGVEAFEL